MRSRIGRLAMSSLLALLVSALLGGASPAQAQQGAVTGEVTARESGQPLSGAQVTVAGTNLGTLTDDDGTYRITGVPTGQRTVRVQMIGYRRASREVTVSSGQAATANFQLTVSAVDLEEVVVTATGRQQLRELGNSVSTISADSLVDSAPVRDMNELLAGRSPGVSVQFTGGTVGSGQRIRIRGASSISVNNQPLVYVDGTRINVDPTSLTVGTGNQETGNFTINPENIESVEILKGASAATLYGTEAANGVIRITTKDGSGLQGAGVDWRFWGQGGVQVEPNEYPTNYRAVTADGAPCPLTSAAAGACTQDEIQTFNLLENPETTPFSTGERYTAGGSVTGSTEGLNYFSSAEWEFSQGVYGDENELDRVTLRGNFGGRIDEGVTLRVNTGFITRDVTLPQNDNNTLGLLPNGLLGGASEDGWFSFAPSSINTIDTQQETERFTGSANLTWNLNDWLTLNATGGMDILDSKDTQLFPVGGIGFGRLALGERASNQTLTQNYTGEAFVRASRSITDDIRSRTTVGSQYFVDIDRTVFTTGEELVPNTNSVATAAVTTAGEAITESRTLGVFAQQRFSWRQRLYLTGGVRVDDNSAFGTDFGRVVYPSVNASWVMSEEPWFPSEGLIGSLRLRGSFGQAGNQPGTTDAVRFLEGVSVTSPAGADRIGVTFEGGNVGNPDLSPERTTELEAGFEASMFEGRVTLSGTYFNSTTEDVLVQRTLAPSLGVSEDQFVNLAEVRNEGVEGQLGALLLDIDNLRFNLNLTGAYTDNTLIELGEGISPIDVGFVQQHAPGYPLGGYWANTVESFEDENGDGIIGVGEVEVTDEEQFIDESTAPVELTASPSMTLFDYVRLQGLLEARMGHSLHNNTEGFRCLLANSRFRNDPDSSLEKQAACVANAFYGAEGAFVQDADFMRLRELSATFTAPRSLAQQTLGVDNLSLTLSGRNLALWTEYDGIDPEVNQFGAANFSTSEFLTQPPLRYWNARVNVSF